MTAELIALSEVQLDLPAPVGGWPAELGRRGIEIVEDDIGRPAISRATARALFAEHRERQEVAARRRVEAERRAVEAGQAWAAALPKGIPMDAVPPGVSAAQAMMLSDPFPTKRRQSVLEHALENPGGAIVYTPINEDGS